MKKKGAQKRKKNVSSKSNKVETVKEEAVNPFELKVNKTKHSVLGLKSKRDKGNMGVSRNRAFTNRLEYFKKNKLKSKSNAFVDKRMADKSMGEEDLAMARMMKARKKKLKKNIYNLNDEDIELTHLGQPLSTMEKIDKYESESDEDDAKLDADFVEKAHFGGLFTKKEDENQMTHREILDNLILESKRKKEEKKAEKELNEDMTVQLDKDWKDLQLVISGMRRKDDGEPDPKRDNYDMTLQELKFEPKGTVSAALQSEEQAKKAAEEKMKKLEQDRLSRMMNPFESDHLKKLMKSEMSADNIYDGLDIEDSFEPDETMEEDDDNDVSSEDEEVDNSSNNDDEDIEEPDNEPDAEVEFTGTTTVPQTVKVLMTLLDGKSCEEVPLLLQSIMKSHHPSLRAENKAIIEKFFSVIIEYLSAHWDDKSKLKFLDASVPHLYAIAQMSPLKTGLIFRKFLLEKILKYSEDTPVENFPALDILVLLKLCCILYSTSDFHHPIATPAMLFMSDVLTNNYEISLFNVLSRLFVSSLVFEYISFSKRLAHEPICFLQDVLYMASNEIPIQYISRYNVSSMKQYLNIDTKVDKAPVPVSLEGFCDPTSFKHGPETKVSIVYLAVNQLIKYVTLYYDNIAFTELFSVVALFLQHLPVALYPKELSDDIAKLENLISTNPQSKVRKPLTYPNKKPRMIKMLEPKFKMNHDDDDERETYVKQLKKQKQFSQKIKREERGLIRELRRDAQFVANQQIKQKMAADEERKQKVKRLYQELSVQEGECKKYLKKK